MKLQKQVSRKVGDIEYSKWVVVIPSEKIKEANWKNGQELEIEVKQGTMKLKTKD